MKLYLCLCELRALSSILRRDSHLPGVPVQRVLYCLFVVILVEISDLNVWTEIEFWIVGVSLFHSRVQ